MVALPAPQPLAPGSVALGSGSHTGSTGAPLPPGPDVQTVCSLPALENPEPGPTRPASTDGVCE